MAALISRSGDPLPALAYSTFRHHLERREQGEPVARILGEAEFFGLHLKLGPAVLVPRPETETLVELVLTAARNNFGRQVSICDLGTGSGAIAIALLAELREARAVATDISEDALSIAMLNAKEHGVHSRLTLRKADFGEAIFGKAMGGPFDIVVSNPPYVRTDVIGTLDREVRQYDPEMALDGGRDGLAAYRAILAQVTELIAPGGLLALEIGHDQGRSVGRLCGEAHLSEIAIHKDLAGRERVVMARKGASAAVPKATKKSLGKVGRFRLASAR